MLRQEEGEGELGKSIWGENVPGLGVQLRTLYQLILGLALGDIKSVFNDTTAVRLFQGPEELSGEIRLQRKGGVVAAGVEEWPQAHTCDGIDVWVEEDRVPDGLKSRASQV